ncbi:MAG: hypothetical protein K0S18_1327 [Anaerocolumna sp.]|nr:hypothetical protein [Anaerocolumna sp.]
MIISEKGCDFDNWLKTRKAIAEFIEEYGFTVDQDRNISESYIS